MKTAKVRLYVDQPLRQGQSIELSAEQAHYLFSVMRLRAGAVLRVFNGREGEWLARVDEAARRRGSLSVTQQSAPQMNPSDLWLLFAPLKNTQTGLVVEKAVELGVARIQPVLTEHTNAERVRVERLRARAREAAEQCGATFVPDLAEAVEVNRMLDRFPPDRMILFCDEGLAGSGPASADIVGDIRAADAKAAGKWAVLIGPEGGFSPAERRRLTASKQALGIALGPRILRAETAAIAALTLWQAALGDWRIADRQGSAQGV